MAYYSTGPGDGAGAPDTHGNNQLAIWDGVNTQLLKASPNALLNTTTGVLTLLGHTSTAGAVLQELGAPPSADVIGFVQIYAKDSGPDKLVLRLSDGTEIPLDGGSTGGDHSLLSNLQGGVPGEYYHLSLAQYQGILAGSGHGSGSIDQHFDFSKVGAAEGLGVVYDASLNLVPGPIGDTVPDATTTVKGIVELATDGETAGGVVVQGDDSRLAAALAAIPDSEKGAALGVATLDGSSKIPLNQLPIGSISYLGAWDASLNVPNLTLPYGGNSGDTYTVTVAGTIDLNDGNGARSFAVNDRILFGGGAWVLEDNTDSVGALGDSFAQTHPTAGHTAGQISGLGAAALMNVGPGIGQVAAGNHLHAGVYLPVGHDGGNAHIDWTLDHPSLMIDPANVQSFAAGATGLVPPSGDDTANYLRADGVWAVPPGGIGHETFIQETEPVSWADGDFWFEQNP